MTKPFFIGVYDQSIVNVWTHSLKGPMECLKMKKIEMQNFSV